MKKRFAGLRTAIYRVPDVTEGKAWYAKVFDAQPYFDEPFYVGFEIGGYELGIHPLEPGEAHPGPGGVETYWGVEDVKAEYERLLSLGATPHHEPQNVGGPIEVAIVKDPWGNLLGIIYNPLFKAQ
ncbi:VOC family protein [Chitinophaga lutea]|uniref:VOC family protein n=1 Tax=Chitinophaga lutea TaxID=2488634 RepID=A0A3N4PX35_9BACT|nr:VOC family protein [Chitinophaga lutea]RPE09691.1 VOC family protein [Chitinophaga lutea]